MKINFTFLIAACLLLAAIADAQTNEPATVSKGSKIYFAVGGGAGYKSQMLGFSGTWIMKNDWGFSLSYKGNNFEPRNLPSDYYQGLDFVKPYDYLHFLSFNYLREFDSKTKLLRYGIEAGPSLVTEGVAVFTHKPYAGLNDLFESNYTYTYAQKPAVGLSVRGKIEFPFSRFAGLEGAVFANVNAFRSIVGGEIYLTLGKVRDRIKNKK